MTIRAALAIACVMLTAGCYHATIDTGLPPSAQVYHQQFASSWVYGLVPPKPIKAMEECPNGVARVETQLSFVNQLVGFLTLGIYTPMEIKVTCAASGAFEPPEATEFTLNRNASDEDIQRAFMEAADMAVSTGRPVYVSY